LKPWHTDNPPKSWLTEDDGNVGVDVLVGIDDLAVDGQVRRPVDNVGVVATGAVNSDGVGDIRRDDGGAGVGAMGPSDSNSIMDVGRSDENAGVGVRGLDSSYNTVKFRQGDADAGVGATGLVKWGGESGAERSDALVVMGPVNTGVVADIGWPDSTVEAVGAVVQGDVTGTLGEPGCGGGSASTGPGILGQASGIGDPGDGGRR